MVRSSVNPAMHHHPAPSVRTKPQRKEHLPMKKKGTNSTSLTLHTSKLYTMPKAMMRRTGILTHTGVAESSGSITVGCLSLKTFKQCLLTTSIQTGPIQLTNIQSHQSPPKTSWCPSAKSTPTITHHGGFPTSPRSRNTASDTQKPGSTTKMTT